MFWGLWSEYKMIRRTEICTFKAHSVSLGRKEARAPLSTVRDATWPAPFSPAPLQLLPQVSTRVSWAPALRRRLLIRPLAYASARDRGVCAGAPRRLQGAWSSPRQLRCYNGRQRLAFSEEGRVSICSPASLAESCESLTAQKVVWPVRTRSRAARLRLLARPTTKRRLGHRVGLYHPSFLCSAHSQWLGQL